jgi:phosphoribosylformylglycinamidine synthase
LIDLPGTHLSAKEIIGNESQERMGLVVVRKTLTPYKIADRERLYMYQVGDVTRSRLLSNQKLLVLNQWICLEDFGSSQKWS